MYYSSTKTSSPLNVGSWNISSGISYIIFVYPQTNQIVFRSVHADDKVEPLLDMSGYQQKHNIDITIVGSPKAVPIRHWAEVSVVPNRIHPEDFVCVCDALNAVFRNGISLRKWHLGKPATSGRPYSTHPESLVVAAVVAVGSAFEVGEAGEKPTSWTAAESNRSALTTVEAGASRCIIDDAGAVVGSKRVGGKRSRR